MIKSLIEKARKYFTLFLLLVIMVMGVTMYLKNASYEDQVVKLHNKIAMQSKTVEIHKNAYAKKSVELEDLNSVLKTFEKEGKLDKEAIKKLRKLIDKKDEDILAANRLAAKWKNAYEAEAEANQTTIPGDDPDDPETTREKIDFLKDFGYIGVEGYTLTNPAYAWVRVMQNRPLLLTMAITQSRDGSWNTYVTSSEDNVEVDVKLSAVNPRIFDPSWYEKISMDFGMDINSRTVYPYAGLSYPVGPISLSGGLWAGRTDGATDTGWYATANYSFFPFAR